MAQNSFFVPFGLLYHSQHSLQSLNLREVSEPLLGAGVLFCRNSVPTMANRRALPCKVRWRDDKGKDLLWKAGKEIANGLGAFDNEGAFLGPDLFVLKEGS